MKSSTLLSAFLFLSVATYGQMTKQITKVYEENKFREVINLGARINNYLSPDDEKTVDDLVGRSCYMLQMYDSAVYFENKALSLDNDATSTSGWAYTYRGMAQYWLNKKEESIADLQKAIDLDKTHNSVEVAKNFLANIKTNSVPDEKYNLYFVQGQYKNAIAEGRAQLQKQDYKDVMEIVGASYYYIHHYDSAIYFERMTIAHDADSTFVSGWAHVYLGMALYNNNQKENAIAELRKAIMLNKTSNSVRKAENFLDAIVNGRIIAIDSLHQAIKEQLSGNNYRGAANIALAAIAANPDNSVTWDQLAAAYCWLHNFDSSIYCCQRSLSIDKEGSLISNEIHLRLGIVNFIKNDLNASDRELTAAINDRANDDLKKRVKHVRMLTGQDESFARWKTIEKENIIFHFQNKKEIDDVDALMARYEKEYINAIAALPSHLPKKIDLFVWENESLARAALRNEANAKKEVSLTDADYCVAHIAQNTTSSPLVFILGHWQKKQ